MTVEGKFEILLFVGGPEDAKYHPVAVGEQVVEKMEETTLPDRPPTSYVTCVRTHRYHRFVVHGAVSVFVHSTLSPDEVIRLLVGNYPKARMVYQQWTDRCALHGACYVQFATNYRMPPT